MHGKAVCSIILLMTLVNKYTRCCHDFIKELWDLRGDMKPYELTERSTARTYILSFAIYCYYCNSANNSACLDVNQYEEDMRARIIPIVNCEKAIPRSIAVNFFCRKIVQTIFLTNKVAEVRVTRGCGWIANKNRDRDCDKHHTSDHLDTACQCFSDMCNGGENFHPPYITMLLMLAACLYWS